ncbi:recombination protein NinB [Hydromonas duriensis]|uniref:NinB protein n=1 Tax=Hydromonas duriensis TaxID=1527608 RepID=A0A4R6Y5X6_9BURK|nr:recombination protein NinB [Hydromonas duriensis]TDR30665.1 NinB protein [Hydromonas duriensis]
MPNKTQFIVLNDAIRARAIIALKNLPLGMAVIMQDSTRTLAQNAALWPALRDVAEQVLWCGKARSKEQWKDIFTGSYFKGEYVPNIDGTGVIALGAKTSLLSKKEFAELLEYIYAFGAQHQVQFRRDRAYWLAYYDRLTQPKRARHA